ncbi:MAG: livH 3 [Firmicutes bacterium]|nr:livH 3 [Bacillota bacterium]
MPEYAIIQSILNGILLGGLYAIVGIGMSMVFGIMGLTNLAHGDMIILSTFLCIFFVTQLIPNIFLALIITILIMMALGFLIQNFLVNRVLDKGGEPALLVTFGVSIFIQNVLLMIFGADAQVVHTQLAAINIITTKFFSVSALYLFNFIVALLVIGVLHCIVYYTYFGRSIRATSDNVVAAELMGVSTKRIYSYTMCLAMVSAAIAGLLIGMTFISYPSTGTQYLIIAFGVVVIGGMGSLIGTLLGGIILGLAQLLGAYFFGAGYQALTGYIVLLIILTVRPQGLLGTAIRK